jgi:hypothetical protein
MANLWNSGLADSVRVFHGLDHVSTLHAKFLILVWFGVKATSPKYTLQTSVDPVNVSVHCGHLTDYSMLELVCATRFHATARPTRTQPSAAAQRIPGSRG